MTATAAVEFEFRCTGCWQPLVASIDDVGGTIECRWCRQQVAVPEATENRIQRAVEQSTVSDSPEPLEEPEFQADQLSREQIAVLAAERAKIHVAGRSQVSAPEAMPQASRMLRLVAVLVDSLLITLAAGAGGVLVVVLAGAGLIDFEAMNESPASLADLPWQAIGVLAFFPFAISFVNWNLITTHGQTIGKKLCGIKIVDDQGDPPGFFRGVVIRNWMRHFLGSLIPFFGLVDVLFIFSDPPRCVHDRMASTFVVQVQP